MKRQSAIGHRRLQPTCRQRATGGFEFAGQPRHHIQGTGLCAPLADASASDGVAIRMAAGPAAPRSPGDPRWLIAAGSSVRTLQTLLSGASRASEGARPNALPSARASLTACGPLRCGTNGHGRRVGTGLPQLPGRDDRSEPYMRLWLGHAHDDAVRAVWFDRAFLVRQSKRLAHLLLSFRR